MYQTVHSLAACEAEEKAVPGPPQAQGILFLPKTGDGPLYFAVRSQRPRASFMRPIT